MFMDIHILLWAGPHSCSHYDDDAILLAGMRATGNIASGNDQATQVVVDSGGLAPLLRLLDWPRVHVRKEVFWTLSNIAAGTVEQKKVQGICIHFSLSFSLSLSLG